MTGFKLCRETFHFQENGGAAFLRQGISDIMQKKISKSLTPNT